VAGLFTVISYTKFEKERQRLGVEIKDHARENKEHVDFIIKERLKEVDHRFEVLREELDNRATGMSADFNQRIARNSASLRARADRQIGEALKPFAPVQTILEEIKQLRDEYNNRFQDASALRGQIQDWVVNTHSQLYRPADQIETAMELKMHELLKEQETGGIDEGQLRSQLLQEARQLVRQEIHSVRGEYTRMLDIIERQHRLLLGSNGAGAAGASQGK
jgi:hypothetical protein